MAFGQSAQPVAAESSRAQRQVSPAPSCHTQRASHVMGRHCLAGAFLCPISTRPRPALVAAASGARPTNASSPATSPSTAQPGHGLVGTLPFNESDYVEVGSVVGAHGVRGELRLELSTDQPGERFRVGNRLFLLPHSARGGAARSDPQALSLIVVTAKGAKMRPRGKGEEAWMVALEEVTNRTQAEQLRGALVYCSAADRGALRDPDEFYVSDIIGCTVVHKSTRRMVGLVVDVYGGTGTHDTLRVKLRANEEDILNSRIRYCSIPFAKSICPVLDLASRTLEVAPPEGLLDLVTEEKLRKPLSDEAKAQKLAQLRETLAREALTQPVKPQQQDEDEAVVDDLQEQAAVAKERTVRGQRQATSQSRSATRVQKQQQQQQQQQRRAVDSEKEAGARGDEEPEEGGEDGGEGGVQRLWPRLRRRSRSLRLGRRRP